MVRARPLVNLLFEGSASAAAARQLRIIWARATLVGNEALVKELELLSRIIAASGYSPAVEMAAAVDMGVAVEVAPHTEMPTSVEIPAPVDMAVTRRGQTGQTGQTDRATRRSEGRLVTRTG